MVRPRLFAFGLFLLAAGFVSAQPPGPASGTLVLKGALVRTQTEAGDFVGTEGRIAVDRNALVSDPPNIVREPLRPDEIHLYRSDSHSGNFLHCVRTRQPTICNASVAHRAASALLLGGVAKQLRRNLKWDPQAEQFPDDDEANRLLSIAKRPPWRL